MWRKKAADDAPLDKLRDYKEDLKKRLRNWTGETYGYGFDPAKDPDTCCSEGRKTRIVIDPSSGLDLPIQSEIETKPPMVVPDGPRLTLSYLNDGPRRRSYSLGNFRAACYHLDEWKKRRMLKVGHVPYRGMIDDPNPVLFFDA
jgi:hypothetical protein